MPSSQPELERIVAVAVCNAASDLRSVMLVDMNMLAELACRGNREAGRWLAALRYEITTSLAAVVPNAHEAPTTWEVLLDASPGLPARVTDLCVAYYDG